MDPQTKSLSTVRRPAAGFGWGAVVGAGSGVAAALTFVLALLVSTVAVEGLAFDSEGLLILLIYGLVGAIVGAAIGSAIGAPSGLIFGATRTEAFARFVAPIIGVIPFVIGPRMLEEEGWTVGFAVGMVVVAIAYAVIGWMAGQVFAAKLREADLSDEANRNSANEQAEINRLVDTQ